MARTRLMARRRPPNINFDRRRFVARQEPKNTKNKGNFKIKFLLDQPKSIDVKNDGRVVRNMNVRRRALYLAKIKQRRYGKN